MSEATSGIGAYAVPAFRYAHAGYLRLPRPHSHSIVPGGLLVTS
jgi:hypothetical protein